MSWTSEAKTVLQLASSALTGLEMIGEIVEPILDGKTAALDASVLSALRTIRAIVTTLQAGAAGEVSSEMVTDSLTHLHAQLDANDRQAQADIDAKFPPAG
jgi:DNA-binding NarL/FixJ family response regulator